MTELGSNLLLLQFQCSFWNDHPAPCKIMTFQKLELSYLPSFLESFHPARPLLIPPTPKPSFHLALCQVTLLRQSINISLKGDKMNEQVIKSSHIGQQSRDSATGLQEFVHWRGERPCVRSWDSEFASFAYGITHTHTQEKKEKAVSIPALWVTKNDQFSVSWQQPIHSSCRCELTQSAKFYWGLPRYQVEKHSLDVDQIQLPHLSYEKLEHQAC